MTYPGMPPSTVRLSNSLLIKESTNRREQLRGVTVNRLMPGEHIAATLLTTHYTGGLAIFGWPSRTLHDDPPP
jgi:hypothetical protein